MCAILSRGSIDDFDEGQLDKERERLKLSDPFTVLEYIKTSIEILMNMKIEESEFEAKARRGDGSPDST